MWTRQHVHENGHQGINLMNKSYHHELEMKAQRVPKNRPQYRAPAQTARMPHTADTLTTNIRNQLAIILRLHLHVLVVEE